MSSSDPALSFEEAIERELSRCKNVIVEKEKVEMERVKGERDSLKKEVEELRLKMMESHQTSPFDKSILQDLEQALQTVRKANAALAGAPRVGSSSKGQSKKDNQGETPQEVKEGGQREPDNQGKNSHEVEEGAGSSAVDVGTEEAAKKSVFAQTKQYNQHANLEAGAAGRTAADRFRPKEAYNSVTVIEKQVDRDGTPEARDVAFNLRRCCDLNIINQIKKNLCSENLERFEKSCFGHFLNLNQLEYQGHVLLHLVMHMDMAASSNERLVFRIKNSAVEFGPRDFSHITGLRLGELGPMIKMSSPFSSILRDAFKNQSKIFLKHIKAAFLSVSCGNKGSGELALKLAMLYFLHGNLLSDNPVKKIDLKYFTLVEDLDRFDEFPWGRVAFEFLASSMLSARRYVNFSNASHRRLSNQCMSGFSFALQVWAYETMPSLAEFCEARVVIPETTPTILRWSALKRFVRFEYLKVFFETDQGPSSVVQGIRASLMEAKRRPRETTIRGIKEEKDNVCDAAKPSPSTAAGEVITISDDEDDDGSENRRKRKRNEEAQ